MCRNGTLGHIVRLQLEIKRSTIRNSAQIVQTFWNFIYTEILNRYFLSIGIVGKIEEEKNEQKKQQQTNNKTY